MPTFEELTMMLLNIVQNQAQTLGKLTETNQRLIETNDQNWITVNKCSEKQTELLSVFIQTQQVQSSSRRPVYTALNTPLSATNSLRPIGIYKQPCFICEYYGHGLQDCQNIKSEYLGSCIRCWTHITNKAKDCKNQQRKAPFKENYLTPQQLINTFY